MKYGFMAVMMPVILDKTTYNYLNSIGIKADLKLKKKIRKEYKEMVRREKENNSAFSEKTIRMRQESAVKSQSSDYEMDWVSTFCRGDDGNSYHFTYTKCGLCELGKKENCFHLIKYLCKTDYISFDKAGAKLTRNHTIANGDDYCDFHVERK